MFVYFEVDKSDNMILWIVSAIVLLILVLLLIRDIRDRRLLKTVTSLNRGTKSERNLVLCEID